MDNLPPWPARCEADNLRMLEWLEHKLNEITRAENAADDWEGKNIAIVRALERAEWGDLSLLQGELVALTGCPEIVRFINLPKLRRGQRWVVYKGSPVTEAADDVLRIRALWRTNYGKKKRRSTDGWSAEQFAAMLWEVAEHQVIHRVKKKRSR
jgi:hypothetical protein